MSIPPVSRQQQALDALHSVVVPCPIPAPDGYIYLAGVSTNSHYPRLKVRSDDFLLEYTPESQIAFKNPYTVLMFLNVMNMDRVYPPRLA